MHTLAGVLSEILTYAAFAAACVLAVAAEDRLMKFLTRDTPPGEATGHTAECMECEEWDGWGW